MEKERARVALIGTAGMEDPVAGVIELFGGLPGIKPGSTILIKPNVNSDDPFPATSNPRTVAALVEYAKRCDPKRIIVGDASNVSYLPTIASMRTLGIYEAASNAGAEVIGFEDEEWVEAKPPGALNWRSFKVPRMLLEADYVISQCVVKTHFKAIYSMALKNWMGVVDHRSRFSVHATPVTTFYKRVAELNLARPADFVVLDGTRAMVSGGPFHGNTVDANIMVATSNITAADATGLAILKYLGTVDRIQNVSVWSQPVLQWGIAVGLGAGSGEVVDLVIDNFEDGSAVRQFLEIPAGGRRESA